MTLQVQRFMAVLVLTLVGCFTSVRGVWSISAAERCRARQEMRTLNSNGLGSPTGLDSVNSCPDVAVFYGSQPERLQHRRCEKLRCDFVSTGCLVRGADQPPPVKCFSIWSMMSQPDAGNCPYTPCEGYNRKSKCVKEKIACQQGQGELVPFGLCINDELCCQFPLTT
ncbi:unnamed protein product [Lymnaea stagnalis]|uniref:Uncharacterized protein n=1 Tax=Lymnaea stagnalis TaxID=6523 RepID=A0AAV2HLC1_LYMST